MNHLLNICNINGAEVEPVDVITFGSPCQDLSVAGKRAGIQDGERSNLFFEAIRIIKEMRDSTNGEYPKYAVWENVPGAFSSNKGYDFHAVLEALCSVCDDTVSIPKPYDKKRTKLVWNKAGEIVGNNYSVAWRTLDAQYWGVPQRRKRIYLVADFRGQRAGEILFKPDCLRGDLQTGNETGQETSADAVGGVDGSAGAAGVVSKGNGDCFIMPERHMSLSVGGGQAGQGYPCVLHDSVGVVGLTNRGIECETAFETLRAGSHGALPLVAQKQSTDGSVGVFNESGIGYWMPGCGCLRAEGENRPSRPSHCVIALQANGIDRADTAGCNGCGWRENESYTLNTVDRHAVCYPLNEQIILRHGALGRNTGFGAGNDGDPAYTLQANHPHAVCYDARDNGDGETACTITGDHQNRITDYTAVAVFEPKSALEENWGESTAKNALRAGASKSSHAVVQRTKPPRKYIIRRLTPTECARLQGFPDWWGELAPYDPADADFWESVRKTHAEINGKKYKPVKNLKAWYEKLHNDGAEYKMWGNGIALPCAEFVLHGIAEQGAKTLGSLFDGSGGFPLAGVLNGIMPIWASEVEPYCIAVTRYHFKEVHNCDII